MNMNGAFMWSKECESVYECRGLDIMAEIVV